ncbi:MAG: hypothetical protein ACE5HQ_13025 [Gemmatimonadota bacterium]
MNVEIRPRATTKPNIFLALAAIVVDTLDVRVERRIRPMYLERRGNRLPGG